MCPPDPRWSPGPDGWLLALAVYRHADCDGHPDGEPPDAGLTAIAAGPAEVASMVPASAMVADPANSPFLNLVILLSLLRLDDLPAPGSPQGPYASYPSPGGAGPYHAADGRQSRCHAIPPKAAKPCAPSGSNDNDDPQLHQALSSPDRRCGGAETAPTTITPSLTTSPPPAALPPAATGTDGPLDAAVWQFMRRLSPLPWSSTDLGTPHPSGGPAVRPTRRRGAARGEAVLAAAT